MADLKFDVDYSDLSRSLDVLMEMGKASKNTATAFEQSFRQIKRWQDTFKGQQGKINSQLEATHQKLQLANKSAKSSAQAFIAHEKAIQDNTNALNRMKMSYDASYAVEQRTLQLKKLLRQEIANGNMTVRQAGAELVKYRKQMVAFNQVQMAATKASNRMGVVTQQAGYQVSDFIVQVQSGTNPFVAFSQQASQLAGVLPLVAGKIGLTTTAAIGLSAALGIIIPLIGAFGAYWLNSRKELDESSESVNTLEQNLKSLDGTLQDWVLTKRAASLGLTREELIATEGLASAEEQLAEANRVLEGVKSLSAKGVAVNLLSSIPFISDILPTGTLGSYEEAVSAAEAAVEKAEQRLEALRQKNFEGRLEQTRRTMGQFIAERRQQAIDAAKAEAQAEKDAATVRAALQSKFIQLRDKEAQEEAQRETELLRNSAAARAAMDASAIAKTEEREKAEYEAYQRGVDQRFEGEEALFQQAVSLSDDLRDKIESDAAAAARAYENAFNASSFLFANRFQDETALMGMPVTVDPNNKPDDKPRKKGPKPTTIEDTIKSYRRQMATEKALMSLTGQRRREEELFLELKYANQDADIKTSKARLRGLAEEMAAMEERSRVIEEAAQEQKRMQDFISQSFESGFMSIIDGTQSVKDAFRSMARDIIAELYRVLVVKKLVSAATGFFGFADGGVFQGGSQVQAFANGGVVGGPTFFPMSGGKTGLMGEAGPEAIMPLKRGKNGKLGVEASGESGNVTVVQNFSFSANGDDSVKKIIAQEAPKIAQMTQQQILESRKRGGSFRKAFG